VLTDEERTTLTRFDGLIDGQRPDRPPSIATPLPT